MKMESFFDSRVISCWVIESTDNGVILMPSQWYHVGDDFVNSQRAVLHCYNLSPAFHRLASGIGSDCLMWRIYD